MDGSVYDDAFEAPVEFEEPDEELDLELYGLLHRGYMTDEVTLGHHKIVIRTLRIGEELEAALVADKYKDTIEAGRALATSLVAASVVTVDGKPLIEALGPEDELLETRFKYLLENWYWVTVRQVYEKYQQNAEKMFAIYGELKKD